MSHKHEGTSPEVFHRLYKLEVAVQQIQKLLLDEPAMTIPYTPSVDITPDEGGAD